MEITINRPKQFADKLRNYHLWADDKKIAVLKPNSHQVVNFPDGVKSLRATIDWCSSPEFSTKDITSGQLVVKNSFADSFLKAIFFPLYYITFGKNKYLKIEDPTQREG